MIEDKQLYLATQYHILKYYFLNNNKEIIYYEHFLYIKLAKLDESNSLKDEIILFNDTRINDFVPISDDKICIIYNKAISPIENEENKKKYKIFMLIKSLKNDKNDELYEIPIDCIYDLRRLRVKYFKEKNQLIIIDIKLYRISLWNFNEDIQRYQFFLKLCIDKQFEIDILNKNTFIISTNDCLLLYDANTLKIKKKIYYDDEEEINENNNIKNEDENEDEYEVDVGTEGNYVNEISKTEFFTSCLSNDKNYLTIIIEGRFYIYNTKNFKKEKIKKFQNFLFSFLPFYSYSNEELEIINTLHIYDIEPVSNYFILHIRYVSENNNNKLYYKYGLIPLKKIGKIWKFSLFMIN